MSRTTGTYTLTSNIEPKVGAPLDARTIVKLKSDLTTPGTFAYPYVGLTVFVEEDQKKYTLTDIHYTYIANWREEGSGTTTSADHVTYDNTTSQLESTNVQDAVDEIVNNLGTAASKDATDQVIEDSEDLITSGAVYDALENLPSDDTWRNIKVNGTEKLGTANTTGAIDFINGTNTTVSFDTTGNKIKVDAVDTTYTFADGTNGFSVTPAGGTAQTVTVTPSIADATTSASGLMSAADKTKLDGVATGAEVNQNAFSNITVGSTTIAADSKTDTVEFVAGSNVTITPDATNSTVTIAATVGEDTKVTQTATSTNANYEILFSETADNTTRTEGARKAATLRFNPSKGALMEGYYTVATGYYSHAEGDHTTAKGGRSHAEGNYTCASGTGSHAEGGYGDEEEYSTLGTFAIGENSHAEGFLTTAYAVDSHAEGYETFTNGDYSHAEGFRTTANKTASHAEGSRTLADGYWSHAEGEWSQSLGSESHAEGDGTTASGSAAHAEGHNTSASGSYSHAEGNETIVSSNYSHAEGWQTTASGSYSHVEGRGTYASAKGSHAEGYLTTASGENSHSEGNLTTASGENSHAEGNLTRAHFDNSHAEGYQTTAYGYQSHAEGNETSVSGNNSHAEGRGTVVSSNDSHAEGVYTTASGEASHVEGVATLASGESSHAEGTSTQATGNGAHAEGGYSTTANNGTFAIEENAHAEGYLTTASGRMSHAEGYQTCSSGNGAHSEGCFTTASGIGAHAEGNTTIASEFESHAEGYKTTASGSDSHAEGNTTIASGAKSHAEGVMTKATGENSHAEGSTTTASGVNSHAAGVGTCAAGTGQTVVGKYNVADKTSFFIVGNGTSTSAKSNALKVGSDGKTTLGASGTITSGNSQAVTGGAVYAALQALPSDDTWRSIQVNGTEVQNGTTSSGPLKLVNGTNTSIAFDSTNKTIQVNATDTNTTYSLTQDSSDGHKITLTPSTGTAQTLTIPDNNTTYTLATGDNNGQIKVTPSSGNAYNVNVKGLGSAAYKNITDTYSATGSDAVSGKAIAAALDTLPEPMVFKGSLGTGGTITTLPVDGSASVGDTYKVITAGTYASQAAKVGDTFICDSKTSLLNTWVLIPSGDEPSGTVTSVAVSNGGGLSVSGSPITSSGTITISHADTSSQATVTNSGRTYIQSVTLDTYGHVTKLTSATETVTNTDRYVNSASFAHDSTNNNVKMTLTRAGSDTATVTGNIPLVSSSTAGVAPKGAAVSSQSQSTKFLREDGTWAAPSYTTDTNTHRPIQVNGTEILGNNTTALNLKAGSNVSVTNSSGTVTIAATDTNTTYTLATGDSNGQIKVTPSSGDAYNVSVKGLGSNAYTSTAYLPLAGGTMTGSLTFANATKNVVGDDCAMGDFNVGGTLALQGQNAATSVAFIKQGETWGSSANYGKVTYDGTNFVLTKNIIVQKSNPAITFDNTNTLSAGADAAALSLKLKTADGSAAYTTNVISFIGTNTGDGNNIPVRIGSSNGTTIIGAGEGAVNFASKNSKYNDEVLYLVADSSILLYKDTANDGTISTGPLEAAGFTGTITSGRVVVSSGTRGGLSASSYTIAKSVPSDAVFTDTHRPIQMNGTQILASNTTALNLKAGSNVTLTNDGGTVTIASSYTNTDTLVTQTATTTNANYEVLFSATADNTTRTETARKNNNLLFNPSTGVLYGPNEMRARDLSVSANNGTSGGISLYSASSNMDNYGIYFRQTSNKEKHGYVQGDWATYFTMNDQDNRGWIFRRNKTTGNVASIDTKGNIVANGSVTVGGNAANTSGMRFEYDSTNECTKCVFAA